MVAYIYQKITTYAANQTRSGCTWSHLKGLTLADPNPSSPESIDVLIAADLYGYLLLGQIKRGPLGSPTAQSTVLGWIVSGPTGGRRAASDSLSSSIHCVSAPPTDALLQRFWEIEEIPTQCYLSSEEANCESHLLEIDATKAVDMSCCYHSVTNCLSRSARVTISRCAGTLKPNDV